MSYSYTLNDNEAHPTANGNNSLFEDFAVSLIDSDGDSATNTLSVQIVDDVPTAVNDTNGTASESSVTSPATSLPTTCRGRTVRR
ncbi:hypothetical protein [Aeromonas veronii]|uniref:hypothetical protein n=1 Tax=Aeromonas veronii TaxID=654 RepID=UPI001E4FC8DD|nr:hypothetical protein [Aeromonas veronii]